MFFCQFIYYHTYGPLYHPINAMPYKFKKAKEEGKALASLLLAHVEQGCAYPHDSDHSRDDQGHVATTETSGHGRYHDLFSPCNRVSGVETQGSRSHQSENQHSPLRCRIDVTAISIDVLFANTRCSNFFLVQRDWLLGLWLLLGCFIRLWSGYQMVPSVGVAIPHSMFNCFDISIKKVW